MKWALYQIATAPRGKGDLLNPVFLVLVALVVGVACWLYWRK